jgi:hypothetical protein
MVEPSKFRVVVETFDTAEKAVAFRRSLQGLHPNKLTYIQSEQSPSDWRTWTFA